MCACVNRNGAGTVLKSTCVFPLSLASAGMGSVEKISAMMTIARLIPRPQCMQSIRCPPTRSTLTKSFVDFVGVDLVGMNHVYQWHNHSSSQYITVYHSISQYTTVYHSISQCITVYHSIPQYTTVYHSIPQYIILCTCLLLRLCVLTPCASNTRPCTATVHDEWAQFTHLNQPLLSALVTYCRFSRFSYNQCWRGALLSSC